MDCYVLIEVWLDGLKPKDCKLVQECDSLHRTDIDEAQFHPASGTVDMQREPAIKGHTVYLGWRLT